LTCITVVPVRATYCITGYASGTAGHLSRPTALADFKIAGTSAEETKMSLARRQQTIKRSRVKMMMGRVRGKNSGSEERNDEGDLVHSVDGVDKSANPAN